LLLGREGSQEFTGILPGLEQRLADRLFAGALLVHEIGEDAGAELMDLFDKRLN
jgi:hypothetical protein